MKNFCHQKRTTKKRLKSAKQQHNMETIDDRKENTHKHTT